MSAVYALDDAALLAQCDRIRSTAGGPGGQHAARSRTGVRLVHRVTGVTVVADGSRDGRRNQTDALATLRLRLALVRRGEADPAWLVARRRGRRLPVGPSAGGYHLVVAVLLDALASSAGDPGAAARACGISTTQLVKALLAHKEVRVAADALRREHGLKPLRG